jgi:hypothetical protein
MEVFKKGSKHISALRRLAKEELKIYAFQQTRNYIIKQVFNLDYQVVRFNVIHWLIFSLIIL